MGAHALPALPPEVWELIAWQAVDIGLWGGKRARELIARLGCGFARVARMHEDNCIASA